MLLFSVPIKPKLRYNPVAMAIADDDRCPKCGTLYLSLRKPGEPDTRFCYSCNTPADAARAQHAQEPPPPASTEDELSVQPLENEHPQSRHREMAPQRRPMLPQRPAASAPKARPGGSSRSIPAASRPAIVEENLAPVDAAPPAPPSQPVPQPSRNVPETPDDFLRALKTQPKVIDWQSYITYAVAGVVVLVAGIFAYQYVTGRPAEQRAATKDAPPPETAAKQTEPVATPAKPARQQLSSDELKKFTPALDSWSTKLSQIDLKLTPEQRQALCIAFANACAGQSPQQLESAGRYLLAIARFVPAAIESIPTVSFTAPEDKEHRETLKGMLRQCGITKDGTAALNALWSAYTQLAEDCRARGTTLEAHAREYPAFAAKATAVSPATKKAAEETQDDADVVAAVFGGPGNKPVTSTTLEPTKKAEPAQPVDTKRADVKDLLTMGGRKSPKASADDDVPDTPQTTRKPAEKPPEKPADGKTKPVDALAVLKKDAKEEEKPATNVPPPPVLTEPTIIPLDTAKMDPGSDRSFTEQIQGTLKNWRIKDAAKDNSSTSVTHRGKDGAICLNPPNDKLCAKLTATIEIPPKFKPKLKFEVSSKDAKHEWSLAVTVLQKPLVPRTPIRVPDEQGWIEVPVDLTPLAGKRVEVFIEVWTQQTKNPRALNMKEQLGYIRNIKLEW
ncbi:MAG TPA: hypothetical protein VGP72_03725 [Planctomycetota bacterium]|jgi:hypothetical protein